MHFLKKVFPVFLVFILAGFYPVEHPVSKTKSDLEASVERVEPNKYKISWQTEGSVAIYVSENPDAKMENMQKVADGITRGTKTVTVPADIVRPYFLIVPQTGEPTRVAERVLPLEGGRNFRDLGGYKTENGKTVRWGHLFRSGVLTNLTPTDYDYLSVLNIRVICDFRSTQERIDEPTSWQAKPVPEIISWGYSNDYGDLAKLMKSDDMSAEKMKQVMLQMYKKLPYEHAAKYQEMFERLADGEIPLVFHCTAGKDRAGTGAALLLEVLGVPREVIINDYAMSEKVVDYEKALMHNDDQKQSESKDEAMQFFSKLPKEAIRPLLRSDPAYIKSAFAELKKNHGSVMGFVKQELNVTDAMIAALRAKLLR